jgi:hypothetical protein
VSLAAPSPHHKTQILTFTKQAPSFFLDNSFPPHICTLYFGPTPTSTPSLKEEKHFLVLLVLLATFNFHIFVFSHVLRRRIIMDEQMYEAVNNK